MPVIKNRRDEYGKPPCFGLNQHRAYPIIQALVGGTNLIYDMSYMRDM